MELERLSGSGAAPVFCIVDPNLRDFVGHHAAYDAAVAQAAAAAGYEPIILGHRDGGANPALTGGTCGVGAFRDDIWASRGGGRIARLLDTLDRNRRFAADLKAALPELPRGSVLFAHMLTERQLPGLAWLASGLPDGVRLVALLRYQQSFYRGPVATAAFRRLERLARAGRDIRLCTDSERLSVRIGRLTRLPVATLPIPHVPDGVALPSASPTRPLAFASLGNARGEKGFGTILAAIRLLATRGEAAGMRFLLQANAPSADVAADLAAFAADPPEGVTLIHDSLDGQRYAALLGAADVVLAPYARAIYAERTSGVALEAMAAGRPLLCTQGTWLAEEMRSRGAGVAVPEDDPPALADAILRLRAEWPRFAAEAAAARARCLARHSAAALVAQAAGPWPGATPPGPLRRAALIYPWADFLEARSGASLRANLTARMIATVAEEVTILQDGPASRPGAPVTVRGMPQRALAAVIRRAVAVLALPFLGLSAIRQSLPIAWYLHRLTDRRLRAACRAMVAEADHVLLEYGFWAPIVAPLCRRYRVPLTITAHDVIADQITASGVLHRFAAWLEARCLATADRLICVSAADAATFAGRGLRAEVVPNPIDVARLEAPLHAPPRGILAERHGIVLGDAPFALFVGSSHAPNARAAARLRDLAASLAPLRVVVAGTCLPAGTAPGFQALGPVEDEALRALYRAAAVMLIPLDAGTGASVKTVEAMAAGLPVLGTTLAFRGLEIVPGRDALVEDDIARWPGLLTTLLADPARCASLGEAARRFAAPFDWRRCLAPYLLAPPIR